eukprot:TRINITY_DN12783_c0_g1_i1.p1 TRINITY_DN12783_c0_g1~~TRINITY_DN12783_c0_g1_i1.p1  ORF type:complete len:530 (+),score=57.92 TRINITY_DN12783_c0_g1_i1:55-1590(+)
MVARWGHTGNADARRATLLLFCSLIAGSAEPRPDDTVGTTSSTRSNLGFVQLTRYRNDSNLGLGRGARQSAPLLLSARSVREPLSNRGNVQYIGLLGVGKPVQEISVMFDTGSSDVWLSLLSLGDMFGPAPFRKYVSSTLECPQQPVHVLIKYGRGQAAGDECKDVLTVGGVVIPSMPIVLAQQPNIHGRQFQGVVGLAFPRLSVGGSGGAFIEHLPSAGVDVFTFSLTGDIVGSSLFFGLDPAIDETTLVYASVWTQSWWTFAGGIAIGDKLLIDDSMLALDTGTSFLGMPAEIFKHFIQIFLPDGYDKWCYETDTGVWKCDSAVISFAEVVYIRFGGREFPLYPEDVLECSSFSNECILEILTLGEDMPVILGDTFLRSVRAVFDVRQARIGLAPRPDYIPRSQSTVERLRKRGPLPPSGTYPVIDRGGAVLKPFVVQEPWSVPIWVAIAAGMVAGGVVGWGAGRAISFCCEMNNRRRSERSQVAPAEAAAVAPEAGDSASTAPYSTLA